MGLTATASSWTCCGSIMAQPIVPTLDIDLVWHTHQCTAAFYARDTRGHRRALRQPRRHHRPRRTSARALTSRKSCSRFHFGQQYRLCGCWDCEAMLSGVEDAARLASFGRRGGHGGNSETGTGAGHISPDSRGGNSRKENASCEKMIFGALVQTMFALLLSSRWFQSGFPLCTASRCRK